MGAGSAGCTVAARLSETGATVILLEAGPSDWHPMIHIPAGMRSLIRNPLVNWNFTTEPEKGSGERRIEWPRGRTLGGSSSINGMLYVRGAPADFDGWAQMGARGWSWDDVLPYFKKSESYVQKGDTEIYRGAEYVVNFLPKLRIEIAVSSDIADKAVEVITTNARTGQIGDGKIFVTPIDHALRIRTGETYTDAL